jgi:hypothetical protein
LGAWTNGEGEVRSFQAVIKNDICHSEHRIARPYRYQTSRIGCSRDVWLGIVVKENLSYRKLVLHGEKEGLRRSGCDCQPMQCISEEDDCL